MGAALAWWGGAACQRSPLRGSSEVPLALHADTPLVNKLAARLFAERRTTRVGGEGAAVRLAGWQPTGPRCCADSLFDRLRWLLVQ
jgi:hypothetical protein